MAFATMTNSAKLLSGGGSQGLPYQGPGIANYATGALVRWPSGSSSGSGSSSTTPSATTTNRRRRRRRKGGGSSSGGANMSDAVRDVNLALNAQIDAINREQQQAYYDYLNRVNGANAAYGGYQQMVGSLSAPYQAQTQQTMSNLNTALQPYQSSQSNVLGLDPSEYMAGQNSYNAAAAASQGVLASMGQRGTDYLTSAQNEGALSQRYAEDNLLQGWEDSQNQYAQLRLDATDHAGDYVLQRLDELRNQSLQNSALRQQISSNAAYSQMLAGLIRSLGVG